MTYTISTRDGHDVSLAHDRRDKRVVEKQHHIDRNGIHEIWEDDTECNAYHRLFDKAQADYNAKQTRADRRIKNYHSTVKKDGKQHTIYEMVIAVGNKDNRPPDDVGKAILQEFYNGWNDRNPNMAIVGAYYHADEEGVPHVHLAYIPVAHGYKRGMAVQTSKTKACAEMGFSGKKSGAEWWARENQVLERICNDHGLEIDHPRTGRQHVETDLFKAQARYQETQDKIDGEQAQIAEVTSTISQTLEGVNSLQGFRPEILRERKGIVKIFSEDLDNLVSIGDAEAVAKGLQKANKSLDNKIEQLEKAAADVHMTNRQAHDVAVEECVQLAVKETKDIRNKLDKVKADAESKIAKAEKNLDTALRDVQSAKDELSAAKVDKTALEEKNHELEQNLTFCKEILAFFPEEIKQKARLALEMKQVWRSNPSQSTYELSDSRRFDRNHFLKTYVETCKENGLIGDKDMMDKGYKAIEELKSRDKAIEELKNKTTHGHHR